MAIKDLVFGLSLKADKFDRGMKTAQNQLNKFGSTRLAALQKELKSLESATGKLNQKRIRAITGEIKSLQVLEKEMVKIGNTAGKIDKDRLKGINSVTRGINRQIKSLAGGSGGSGMFGSIFSGSFLGTLAGNLVTKLFGAISAKLKSMKSFIFSSINAGVEGNKVDAGLSRALANAGADPKWLGALEKQADRVRRVFNKDDEDVKKGFTALITGGMSPAKALTQATLMADIAAKNKVSVEEAGKIIAKVYNGETKALKQMGVFIAETNDKRINAARGMQALIATQSGFAAANAATDAPWVRLALAWDEMKQTIGQRLLPVIEPMLSSLGNMLNAFIGTSQFQSIIDKLSETVRYAISWIGALAKNFDFNKFGSSLFDLVKRVGSMFTDMFVHAAGLAADKFREKLPPILGGGKSVSDRMFEDLRKRFPGITQDNIRDEYQKASAASAGNPFGPAGIKASILKRALGSAGNTETFGSIYDRHMSGLKGSMSGSSTFFQDLHAQATAQVAADRTSLGSTAYTNPGVSSRANEIERAKAAKSSKAFVKQHNMKLQVSSYDSNVHPIAGLS